MPQTNAVSLIIDFLQKTGIYDLLIMDANLYIGGSLAYLCMSNEMTLDILEYEVGDIDIYTKNYPLLTRNFNKYINNFDKIEKTGVNIKFTLKDIDIPFQIIISPFDDFIADVLEEYDCDIATVGFHPFSSTFYIHRRFTTALRNRSFNVMFQRTNEERVNKLHDRANLYFNSTINVIDKVTNGDYRSYSSLGIPINNINDILPSPPYLQLYGNKYNCVKCQRKQDYLICHSCNKQSMNRLCTDVEESFDAKFKKVVVFGGVNGLGKIIADTLEQYTSTQVTRTSRSGSIYENPYYFDLAEYENKENNICTNLMKDLMEADCIIFNAYQTLEKDQDVWTTKLSEFNKKLALDRYRINCFGYIGLVNEIINERKKCTHNNDQIWIWMDANESKFEEKLSDGKHLELNMTKTACKQIFYTNAQYLACTGIITCCYDPGWLSYHGISVEKIESKSKYLISPELSAMALLNHIMNINVEKEYENKTYIHDMNVYKLI